MISSRRIAFAAAAVIFGLSACGDPSTSSSSATTVVATSTLPKIKLGGGAVGTAGATPASADAAIAPGERMMMIRPVDFVYSGTMPTLPGTATAWEFPANPAVDQERIAALAKQLGVEGDVRPLGADMGGGWMVGAPDYTTASLTVSADGMTSWWYNPAPTEASGVAIACPAYDPATTDGAATDVAPCPEPTPPVGVPTGDEATAKAKELFTALGYDLTNYEFEVYADQWSANVTAYLVLDGHRTQVSLSAGYGAEGALTWSSGYLAEPQRAGDYPLVTPEVGLQRLGDQQGMYGYGAPMMDTVGGGVARSSIATEPAVGAPSVDPALPTEVAPSETLPTGAEPVPATDAVMPPPDSVLVDPIVIDPAPVDTTPITVTLTDVKLDLTMNWSADGTVWLLPAFNFTDADGASYVVIAVDDAYLEQPAPTTPDPAVTEPAPVPVDTVVPTPDTVAAEPGTDPGTIDPGTAAKVLVGLTEADAQAQAAASGWTMRVVRQDGVDLPATADYSPLRVNVATVNGAVTEVLSVG